MTIQEIRSRLNGRAVGIMGTTRHFAVLVPLVEKNGQLHILYEQRAATLHHQPNEVCFPGGRMEPGETPPECALRETQEELGIPCEQIQIIAALDVLHHRSGFVLHPFLALIDTNAAAQMTCSPAEVKDIFLVPLQALQDMTPAEYRYELVPQPGEDFPYDQIGISKDYPWQNGVETGSFYRWEDRVIWGMTARITRHLLDLLRP